MSSELQKRIITSFFLLSLLVLMFSYTYILIISLIVICIISWIEFYALISKIYKKKNRSNIILRFILKATSLLYLSILIYIILMSKLINPKFEIFIIYSILVSIMSDIGGLVIGRTFKGRKLTRISPKKTISGSIGSFIFSLSIIPFFIQNLPDISLYLIIFITIVISLSSQIGDLFISHLKRNAKVKNTSNLLPGHGGVLDRIDGIIFSIPVGFLTLSSF
jgi:phosphatidate cytidylyltransferase